MGDKVSVVIGLMLGFTLFSGCGAVVRVVEMSNGGKVVRQLIAQFYRRFVAIICVVLLAGCGGNQENSHVPKPTDDGHPTLNVLGPTGSKAAFSILQIAFESSELPYDLHIFESNTVAPGIQGVLDGTFDLMVLMRYPQSDEALAFIAFVRTPVALFVNPSAGVDNLTREQAATAFSGEVTNWSELGGSDQEIVVVTQEADDTSTESVVNYVLEGRPFIDTARVVITERDVLILVEGMPGAIGYATWAGKKYGEFVSPIEYPDAISLDWVPPTDPGYPLASIVGVAYRPEHQSFLQPLFDWGERLKDSETIQLLMEQFGVWWVNDDVVGAP